MAARRARDGIGERTQQQRRDGDAETMVQFKQYVKEMQKSRGRAVEMRIAVLLSIVVALKFFSVSPMDLDTAVLHRVFFFLLIAILIILFTTWLDYFPSKIETFEMRPAGGQGLPLACLLPPMTCIALLSHIINHQPALIQLVSLYLVLCCTISIATVLPTLLNSAPYPNSIIIYNLLLIIIVFVISNVLQVPSLPLFLHCTLYSVFVPFLLYSFPKSFTLCEVSLLCQGVSLLVVDTTLLMLIKFDLYELPDVFSVERSTSFLFLEFGVTGFILCCFLFSFFLYKLACTNESFYIHAWSLGFLQVSFLFAFFVVLPSLGLVMDSSPFPWLIDFLFSSQERTLLLCYWMCVVFLTSVIVVAQSVHIPSLSCLKSESPSSLWMRKWFHLLAVAVYVPGLMFDPLLLSVSSSLVTVFFIVIELIRLFGIWPLGDAINKMLIPFTDERDTGYLILTHTYLLLGFSIPIWLYPLHQTNSVSQLSMYSGVLALGVGDSIAAVSGTLVGRHKWPGTSKTFEGTFMSVVCQFIVAAGVVYTSSSVPPLSHYSWTVLGSSILVGSAMEAYTHQIDNLLLGIVQYVVCIAFL
ncbi:PREDICTED: dolichol kinase-like [Amphimedon queenslandica]|uniref:dolichol kinase n=1 Tax=Amphimedon queenslandica TaxID=400682 RepID=A0A1X7V4F5_AMPQE|nr:PREDICTED: dolichol kinase-like [Amphimedon queenslandica]|eukprot:XP_019850694.1 PREDICTED: dolichol kinase-like [Amphimedon queenslandica]